MDLYLINKAKNVEADAIYEEEEKTITVCKGSRISSSIAGGTFRSAKSVEKLRETVKIQNNMLGNDIVFKSASTAANFVTGASTNGMIAWKTKEGKTFKEAIKGKDE